MTSAPPVSIPEAKTTVTYREAIREGLAEEMRRDATVVLFGEDVAAAGGVFKVTEGLLTEFGPLRVRNTPISENALLGAAIGCAAAGFKPVVEIMFADFLANCFDQLVNHAAKLRYMSGGQLAVPMVVRTAHGGGIGFGAQHSQAACSWLMPFPGLKIVAPATPADAKHLIKEAIRDPDPVVFFEHKALYGVREPVGALAEPALPIGVPAIRRPGSDLTIVALAGTVRKALEASSELALAGMDTEVIDLRGLVPLDLTPIFSSIRRTGHLLVVEEEPEGGGWADRIVSSAAQQAWHVLAAPPSTLSSRPCPTPYAPGLEDAFAVSVEAIVRRAQEVTQAAQERRRDPGS